MAPATVMRTEIASGATLLVLASEKSSGKIGSVLAPLTQQTSQAGAIEDVGVRSSGYEELGDATSPAELAADSHSVRTGAAPGAGFRVHLRDQTAARLRGLALGETSTGTEVVTIVRRLRELAAGEESFAPRRASVSLLLGDALFLNPVSTITAGQRDALLRGVSLLLSDFISAEAEADLVDSLLEAKLDPYAAFDPAEFQSG